MARRPLTPEQRERKNARGRERNREHNEEFERQQKSEAKLKDLAEAQIEENKRLREENERLNHQASDLQNQLSQQQPTKEEFERQQKSVAALTALAEAQIEENERLREENERLNRQASYLQNQLSQLQTTKEVHSLALTEYGQSANDQLVANNQGSQGGVYADELVEDFIQKLDAKEKSDVNYSDFDGLMEEVRTNGTEQLPPSLTPYDTSIKEKFGDIAANSRQSSCTAMPSHILFCAAVKEMDNLQLEKIDERKILLWRNAINSALNINFQVGFAIAHLKKIARAFFGLKAWNDLLHDIELMSITRRIADLETEHSNLQGMHAQKMEEFVSRSEVRKQCMDEAQYFFGNPLSNGLLPGHPSCDI